MPPTIPTLKLTNTSTATAYTFHPVDADKHHHGFGWAICTVNDVTGELAIQSDWGSWQYRWSPDPKNLGAPTLTHFISGRKACHYIAQKLTSDHQRQDFDAEATIKKLRTRLAERRLSEARGKDRLSAETAREIWDALDDLTDCDRSSELFLDRFYRIDGASTWVSEEPWNYIENSPNGSYIILLESILPALVAACDETVKERARAAMPECTNYSQPWFTGRWQDWHRGHGCNKDDGKPRSAAAEAEIAAGGHRAAPSRTP